MDYYPEGICSAYDKKFDNVEEIKQAINTRQICEGRVIMCDSEHNLHIDLGVMMGVIPRSEGAIGIIEGTTKDIALISKVNKRVCFRIMGMHKNENDELIAILSRRNVQIECAKGYLSKLEIGDIINARVTHLEQFGAFIDIGCGINSLIPIDMLCVSRISHPRLRLSEGDMIRCALKSIEKDKMTFTLKELLGTWEENTALYNVGETVTGVVRSVEDYGIFVELMPNLAGLAEACDGIEVGQSVSVFIKSILPEKMKVKLVIVDSFDIENEPNEIDYFVADDHIDEWNYSPEGAIKCISTRFN